MHANDFFDLRHDHDDRERRHSLSKLFFFFQAEAGIRDHCVTGVQTCALPISPITSNTARMGPPAMMPVPSDAGCMITFEEPCLPITACCSVPFFRDTRNILRRASSRAFCTATGTSRALPLPMPTAPSPSPTTVSAAKPRIRPPFTTLVTRFTETIFSFRPSERCSPPCILGCILAIVIPLQCSPKSGPQEESPPYRSSI